MKKAIQIDARDNVATVTSDVGEGEFVEVISPEGAVVVRLRILETVRFGHKLALVDMKVGDVVVKYGETMGVASSPIRVGEWVHIYNAESATVPTSALRRDRS